MGETTETNTNVLSGEAFLGVVALQTPIQKNLYMREMGPSLTHILYMKYWLIKIVERGR